MRRTFSVIQMILAFLASQECRIWLRIALKPVTVLAVLAVMVWLSAGFDARIAHAEANVLACPAGEEQDGALCYPLCAAGFVGEGPVCFQTCPADYTDDGAVCRKNAIVFAKASYGRGGGAALVCAANQQAQGGLCYPRCAAGYYGAGPVCWQFCRAGYADHGATCFRHIFDFYGKPTYGRGAGTAVSTCAAGLERNGSLCYARCQTGYYGAGPVCFQRCPDWLYRRRRALSQRRPDLCQSKLWPRRRSGHEQRT